MFSHRTDWKLAVNRLTQAQRDLDARHVAKPEVADDQIVDVIGKRQLRDGALGAKEHPLLAERAVNLYHSPAR